MNEPHVSVENAELRTVREAMREMNRLVAALDAGDLDKVVLTTHGRMRAVVLTVDEYARLKGSA